MLHAAWRATVEHMGLPLVVVDMLDTPRAAHATRLILVRPDRSSRGSAQHNRPGVRRALATVHRLARLIEAGLVVINGGGGEGPLPFGGFKQSGYGRENGRVGVEAFTEIKSIRVGF